MSAYPKSFSTNQLHSIIPTGQIGSLEQKFNDQIKKKKSFSSLKEKDKSFRGGPKDINLKGGRNLITYMVIIPQNRN